MNFFGVPTKNSGLGFGGDLDHDLVQEFLKFFLIVWSIPAQREFNCVCSLALCVSV